MTRVVCCYASNLRPETRQSVIDYAPGAEFADCSEDDYAYWRAIKERWDTGEDLVIIEQDIVIEPDTVSSFEACSHHWCVFPYFVVSRGGVHGSTVESLGCTRFSAELQATVKARHISQDDYRHWGQVAGRVAVTLLRYGYQAHMHDKFLEHHHSQDEYRERIRIAAATSAKSKLQYQEYLNSLTEPLPAEPESTYWDTRYDLPARRLPG